MKMYPIDTIIELLRENKEYYNNYVGFDYTQEGDLVIVLKEHAPGWRDKEGIGEAVEELTLLENAGEY